MQGIAILVSFKDEPLGQDMIKLGGILQDLGWEAHDIRLDQLNSTQQLFKEVKDTVSSDLPGKDTQLLLFYAGYAMPTPPNTAIGTWHAYSSEPLCHKHIPQADPEKMITWLVEETKFDLLFLLNCPFAARPFLPTESQEDKRTIQHIIIREPFSELADSAKRCSQSLCEQKTEILRLPSLGSEAIENLIGILKDVPGKYQDSGRCTAYDLITDLKALYPVGGRVRDGSNLGRGRRDFVLWERK